MYIHHKMSYEYNPNPFSTPGKDKPVEYELIVSHNSMQFRVKLTPETITVGGKFKNCMQITIKSKEIAWVNSSLTGECELNKKPIGGQDTLVMIHIGLWFLHNGYNDIKYPILSELELTDSSKFNCSLSDSSSRSMSMLYRDALVHGMSFYERKLGAEPRFKVGKEVMEILRKGRKGKQSFFDFRNEDLNIQLRGVYNDSVSWEDFMNKLVKKYGSVQVCQVMYPWYLQAVTDITEGMELPTRWILRDLTPTIEPKIEGPFVGFVGGAEIPESPSFHEGWDVYNLSYKHLITHKKKTRRSYKPMNSLKITKN